MRHRAVARTIGICLIAASLAGCADMFQSLNARGEKFHDSMEERGVEFHDGKAMKVYRF
jgi:hypothetical protein